MNVARESEVAAGDIVPVSARVVRVDHDVGVTGHAAGDDPDVTGDTGLIIEAISA